MSFGERLLSLFEEPLPHSEGLFPIVALYGHDTALLKYGVAFRMPNATFCMHDACLPKAYFRPQKTQYCRARPLPVTRAAW